MYMLIVCYDREIFTSIHNSLIMAQEVMKTKINLILESELGWGDEEIERRKGNNWDIGDTWGWITYDIEADYAIVELPSLLVELI